MTTLSLISDNLDDSACSPYRLSPLFAPLSIAGERPEEEDSATTATEKSVGVESVDIDIRVALENLINMHRRLESEYEILECRYKSETVRWLSGIVTGIAPRLSQALVNSTIDEIAARAFLGASCGPMSIRMNPTIAFALRESYPEINTSAKIVVQEDDKQSETTVLAEWDGGRLAFDAAEAIKELGLLLTQSIVKQESAECANEFDHAKR